MATHAANNIVFFIFLVAFGVYNKFIQFAL